MKKQSKGLGARSSASIHVRLPSVLIEELDSIAAGGGQTRAEAIRDALARHCENSKLSEQADANHAALLAMLEAQERRALAEKLQRDEESSIFYEALQELHKTLKNQEQPR